MKTKKREIVIFFLSALITLMAVGFFMNNIKKKKENTQSNLFSLIAPSPQAILKINKPSDFSKYILSQPIEYTLFASTIPTIYLEIIQNHPTLEALQISFHPQGIVFYAQADEKEIEQMTKETLVKRFHSFAPQTQTISELTFTFYPDAKNNFLGCYYAQGIWVASYSRKLLEQVANTQLNPINQKHTEQKELLKTLDQYAPLNLLIPADSLNLYVSINDSTDWRIQDCWLGVELFSNENHLCYLGSIPHHPASDSLYIQLGDTLAHRLQQRYPQFTISNQTTIEKEQVFYNGCLLSSQQSVK